MDYYEDLKMRNDILSVAFELGYNGKKTGSCFQGDCPEHGSTDGICLVIWPSIQGFRCYHCGKKGDVIDLVMMYKRLDHKAGRDWLADRVGMPHLNEKSLSPGYPDEYGHVIRRNLAGCSDPWWPPCRSEATLGFLILTDSLVSVKFLFLPHGSSFELNSMSIVNQPVHNGIGDGGISDMVMPMIDRELAGD